MNLFEAEVGIVRVDNASNKTCSPFGPDDLLEAEPVKSVADGVKYSCMSCPFSFFAFSLVFLDCLKSCVDRLYRGSEVHLAGLLKAVVL